MTLETRSSALDPFLTMRTQINLLMEPPAPQLLIDGDNLTVTNALDRTDDPAVLITGNNNVFVNETGATLTGTGTSDVTGNLDGAIEISGTGNEVQNQIGAVVTGVNGIVGTGAGNTVINAGDVLSANFAVPFVSDSIAISLGDGSGVQNSGLVRAESNSIAMGIALANGGSVDNSGVVEVSSRFIARGISVEQDGTIVNSGGVVVTASGGGVGLGATSSGSTVQNFGSIRVTTDTSPSNAFGMASSGDSTIWNGGTIEVAAPNGGNAIGMQAFGGDAQNDGVITATATQGNDPDFGTVGMFLNSALGSNSGTIAVTNVGGAAIGVVSTGGGSVGPIAPFSNSGDILATGPEAFGVDGADHAQLTNTGTITATGSVDAPVEFGRSVGLDLQDDASVLNLGSIHALANFDVTGISALDRADIQNDGLVEVSGTGYSNTGIRVGADSTIANTGMVDVQGKFAFAVMGGDRASIQNDGAVTITGSEVFAVDAGQDSMIVNTGTIDTAATFFGSGISARFGSTIQNFGAIRAEGVGLDSDVTGILGADGGVTANAGIISASSANGAATGVRLGSDDRLTNAGEITASGLRAKSVVATGNASVANDGTLSALSVPAGEPSVGIAFNSFAAAQKTVVNTGTITADTAISDNTAAPTPETDRLTVDNTGIITGALALGNGVDIVTNTGTINGDVDLGSGNDVFDGRGGVVNGTVDGGAGDDIIHGGLGNDILVGGDGDDIIFGGAGTDEIDGGLGLDTLDYSASAAGVQVNLGDATLSTSAPIKAGAGTAFGGDAEGDTFQGIEKVIGSSFDDFVYGSPDGSIVELGDGNDVFDNRSAESGNDVIDLGAGNDLARAGAGDDLVQGGAGNDRLKGEGGNDVLLGQDGRDRLNGGLGDDQLDGGAGNDRMVGGGGNDLFTFGLGGGKDKILDFQAGLGSDDLVDLTAFDTILSFDDVLGIATETGHGGHVSTVLTFDLDTTLTFTGVRLADLNEADFVLV